ncbi:hypothetical protein F9K96_01060 [Brucella anthropi]|uniref:hypothetical protein n=1 Tax=Brucella anthropi TaxID=529 RepID=UPI00124E8E47|nr:hypothetical protein [Brucella anthropi]KAB2793793.1 hypothetical protein F9K96_01060 [Brucella anthropi]
MTSFLDTVYAVMIQAPRDSVFDLFVYLNTALTGFGLGPEFAPVIIVASPILAVSLIVEIVEVSRFLRRPSLSSTKTTPTTDAPTSIDDDWADIALELERENRNV